MATIIVGCLAGIWLYPVYSDYRLINALGSHDTRRQADAIAMAAERASRRAGTLRRLIGSLDTASDRRFEALRFILRKLDKFHPGQVDPIWFDRAQYLELESLLASAGPDAADMATLRRRIVVEMLLCGRDNRYVRRVMQSAAKDDDPTVRLAAATLAGRLGDDEILRNLLDDTDPRVAAAAALAAGIAGRADLASRIAELLNRHVPLHRSTWRRKPPATTQSASAEADDPAAAGRDVIACSAYALARLNVEYSQMLCDLARKAEDPQLQERLAVVLTVLGNDQARRAVMDILHFARWANRRPPAMALAAAAKMELYEAAPMGTEVLQAAAGNRKRLLESHVIAALDLAEALSQPCRREVLDICRKLWYPNRPAMLVRAARMLGLQAVSPQPSASAGPGRDACVAMLRDAAMYSAGSASEPLRTPQASAAAAVALWLLAPACREFDVKTASHDGGVVDLAVQRNSAFYVRQAVAAGGVLAGDYVAWNLGRTGRGEAWELGCAFLPGPGTQPREYDPAVRSAGAMLLVLSADSQARRDQAVLRITGRLKREEFAVRGSCFCAMLVAGEKQYLQEVRDLLEIPEFPFLRALRALLAAGDKATMDRLLWNTDPNTGFPLEDLPLLLTGLGLNEVFASACGELPRPDASAAQQTQLWQARIMRHWYGIHRNTLRVGLGR